MNLKKIIPYHIKVRLKYWLYPSERDIFYSYSKKKPKVIITLAADYTNLGDMAITYAQREFLKKIFPNHEILELPYKQTYSEMKSLKRVCSRDDIITICGGGFTGDLYPGSEDFRQFVIQQFPNNKIISFPQTIDFSDTQGGRKLLKKAQKIYSKHQNLTLVARENKSFDIHKKYFPDNKILLTPDIVLSLDKKLPYSKREGVVLCLRSDKERLLDDKTKEDPNRLRF